MEGSESNGVGSFEEKNLRIDAWIARAQAPRTRSQSRDVRQQEGMTRCLL